jgi:hypothetical protein
MRALFLHIDYGALGAYPHQAAALRALGAFLAATELPMPALIDTGGATLECHWRLDEALPVSRWVRSARQLRTLCRRHGLEADDRITVDPGASLAIDPHDPLVVLGTDDRVQLLDRGDGVDPRASLASHFRPRRRSR